MAIEAAAESAAWVNTDIREKTKGAFPAPHGRLRAVQSLGNGFAPQ